MKSHRLIFLAFLVGCSSAAKPPPTTAPSESPAAGKMCNGEVCAPPASCITVVGMQPDSAHDECWVTCGDGDQCPDGLTCTFMHDGPGKVCVADNDD